MKTLLYLLSITFLHVAVLAQDKEVIGEINDLSLVKVNDQHGVMDNYQNYVVSPGDYTEITYDINFDLYRCHKKGGFEICFIDGTKLTTDYLFQDILENNDGSYKVKGPEGVGYVDYEKVIIPPIYDDITIEHETYFEYFPNYIIENDGKKGLFVNGRMVLKPEFDRFERKDFYQAITVFKDKKVGLVFPIITSQNSIKTYLPTVYSSIEYLTDSDIGVLYIVSQDNKYGLFCTEENMVSDQNIEESGFFVLPVEFPKINWKKLKIEDPYLNPIWIVPVKKEGLLLFQPWESTKIVRAEEIIYQDSSTPIGIINMSGKYQVITFDENIVSSEEYDQLKNIDSPIGVQKDGKWGGVDYDGTSIMELKYPSLESLKQAYENGQY